MTIKYVAYNTKGERLSGSLEVDTHEAAQEALNRSDLTVVSLKKELRLPRFNLYEQVPTLFRPKAAEVVNFNREMATLLDSGIGFIQAIKLIQDRVRSPLFKQALLHIIQDVETGVSFSEACAKHPAIFPKLYVRLMSIGESTGKLGPMLLQASNHMEKQAAISSKIKKALRYPVFVLLIGFFAVGIMVTTTLPSLTKLLTEIGGELPYNARLLLSVSDFLESYFLHVTLGIIVALLVGWWYIHTTTGKSKRDRLLMRLPLVKGVAINSTVAIFNRTLTTLLAAGIPLTEAIDLTINATENTVMREALVKVRSDLFTGIQLSQALSKHAVFPHVEAQMVTVGEQSGTLQQNMETLSNLYEKAADQSVDSLTGMIQPAVVVIAGGLVGFMMITLMQSIYGAISQMK